MQSNLSVGFLTLLAVLLAACGGTPVATASPTPGTSSASPVARPSRLPSPVSGKSVTITSSDGFQFEVSASAVSLVASEPWLSKVPPPGQDWLTATVTVTNLTSDRPLPWASFMPAPSLTVFEFYVPQADASGFGKVCTGPPFTLDCPTGLGGQVTCLNGRSAATQSGSFFFGMPAGYCQILYFSAGEGAFYVDSADTEGGPPIAGQALYEAMKFSTGIVANGKMTLTLSFGPVLQTANLASVILDYVVESANFRLLQAQIPLG